MGKTAVLSPDVVTTYERSLTTTVNDIEHIESQSYAGVSVIRVYLHSIAKTTAMASGVKGRA